METSDRRRLGAYDVAVRDTRHVRIFHDPERYAGHVNRGGIWNFGDGELAVAHRVKTVDYGNADWLAAGAHDFSHMPVGATSGILLNRSLDGGETWPESEKAWIWNNERSTDEVLEWLRPREPDERERIDLSDGDAIMHLSPVGEHIRWPLGGALRPHLGSRDSFHLGKRDFRNMPSFCLRSRDRGRTWERHPTLIEGPSISPDTGFLAANLGHVTFDNGVVGIVGTTNHRNISCFYVSYDNGVSWEYVSEVVRGVDPDLDCGFTYMGVHRLPDGRLMTCMHRMPENWPCVAFSADDGMSWTESRYVVSPATHGRLDGGDPPHAPLERSEPRYRSPCALVTRAGRIVITFARRSIGGPRGILGVLSDDLGETWSREFVLRGDAYTWDCGYQLLTELEDGRLFTAYYITEHDGGEPVPDYAVVRQVDGTFFRLD